MGRIYSNFAEALNEITRDLAEMGIGIHPKSYQNKDVSNDPNFDTKELQNYGYTVTNVLDDSLAGLTGVHQAWAKAELEERLTDTSSDVDDTINPGEAYKLRPEVWEQFLNVYGCFDYTYNDRLNPDNGWGDRFNQIESVVNTLRNDPDSRQAYISIWSPDDLSETGGNTRIPCTLGYLCQIRGGKLNLTYMQRSSDFATHFQNDVWLAVMLQRHIAEQLGIEPGMFSHFIGSLHIFHKDVKGVF